MEAKKIAFSRRQIYIVASLVLLTGSVLVFSATAAAQDLFSPSPAEGVSSKAMGLRLEQIEARLDAIAERAAAMPPLSGSAGEASPAHEAKMREQLDELLKGEVPAGKTGGLGLIDEEPDASGRKVVGIINNVKIYEKNSKMGSE